MKLALAALICLVLYQGYHSQELQQQLAESRADCDTLQAEFNEAHAASQSQLAAAKSAADEATEAKAAISKNDALLKQQADRLAAITAERDKAVADAEHFRGEAESAKRDAAKEGLTAKHNTCPPPENDAAPAVSELAPRVVKDNGEFEWPQDYEKACEKARELKRPVLVMFATNGCIHCQTVSNEVLSTKQVCNKIFRDFVPCYIMVDRRDSPQFKLADTFGVNQFQYPAAVMLWPDSDTARIFRPRKTPDAFLEQVESQRAELKQ